MPSLIRPATATFLAMALASGAGSSQDEQPDSRPETSTAPAASGGLRAYLDPTTGRLIDHPPYGKSQLEFGPTTLRHFSTSHFGLIERVLPNGLILVDLQGRFRQGSVANTDANGEIQVHRIGGEIFRSRTGKQILDLLHASEQKNEHGDKEQ